MNFDISRIARERGFSYLGRGNGFRHIAIGELEVAMTASETIIKELKPSNPPAFRDVVLYANKEGARRYEVLNGGELVSQHISFALRPSNVSLDDAMASPEFFDVTASFLYDHEGKERFFTGFQAYGLPSRHELPWCEEHDCEGEYHARSVRLGNVELSLGRLPDEPPIDFRLLRTPHWPSIVRTPLPIVVSYLRS